MPRDLHSTRFPQPGEVWITHVAGEALEDPVRVPAGGLPIDIGNGSAWVKLGIVAPDPTMPAHAIVVVTP